MPQVSRSEWVRPSVSNGQAPPEEEGGCNRRPLPCKRWCRCSGSPTRSCLRPDWANKVLLTGLDGNRGHVSLLVVVVVVVVRGFLSPGLDVLGHDAPRQVVVAVIASWVVEEVGSGGEDVAGEHRAALGENHHKKKYYTNKQKHRQW